MGTSWNLRITDRRGRAKVLPMPALPLVFGRDDGLPVPLDDPQISRRHCQLDSNDDKSFKVQDLNSTNGTLLNGRKVTRGVASDGDRIKIGDTILEFVKVEEVSVDEDTGMRNLSVLKSFSGGGGGGGSVGAGAASPEQKGGLQFKADKNAAVLSRIGNPGGGGASNNRLTLIAEIGHILTELTDRDEVLKMILSGLIEVYPIERVAVLVKNEERESLEPCVSKSKEGITTGIIVSRTICQHILKTGEAIITESAIADPRFSSGDSIIEHRVGSVIAAPVKARGQLLGVLYASTTEKAAHFSDADLSFLALIGNLVALAILLDRKPAA